MVGWGLYRLGINLYGVLLRAISPFHKKANKFVKGRKNWEANLALKLESAEKVIWMHCSSLGEFEQGRPIFEGLMNEKPNYTYLLTFFSPSGYEPRQNYQKAIVQYLPLDKKSSAQKFIELTNPSLAIFVKYEFWPNYLLALDQRGIPTFLVSGIFRSNHYLFSSRGAWMRQHLHSFNHIFCQDKNSVLLLKSKGINKVSVAGDSRFDQVLSLVNEERSLDKVSLFKSNKKLLVLGSTWPIDEDIFSNLNFEGWKVVVAPHNVSKNRIEEIEDSFKHMKSCRYSTATGDELKECQLLILDGIGLLKYIYRYANLSYIGGGFGVGIHNTLEAAAYGSPILFGPKYHKFLEAIDLLNIGAARTISGREGLEQIWSELGQDYKKLNEMGSKAEEHVRSSTGASQTMIKGLLASL